MTNKRVHLYKELVPTLLAPLLLGSFLSLAWESKENWIFTSIMYVLAISIQQNLFGEKHFDTQNFGQSETSSGTKKGLFLFGHWMDPETEDLSENRKLMELSKISYGNLMLFAQIAIIGGYLFAVVRTQSMAFHFATLIHLAAVIYLMLTTHKGHLFLALVVNLIPVVLALRTGSEAPPWVFWLTIPYAIALIHALVSLHDFDLKRIFDDRSHPWILSSGRTFAKTRRVIFDFLPLVLFFLMVWKLFLKTGNEVSTQWANRFSPEKISKQIVSEAQRMVPRPQNPKTGDAPEAGPGGQPGPSGEGEAASDGNGSGEPANDGTGTASAGAAGGMPAMGGFDRKALEKEMKALQDPANLQKLGVDDRKNLEEIVAKLSQPASAPNSQLHFNDDGELVGQLGKMKELVKESEKDGDPFESLSKPQGAVSPKTSAPEDDDVAQMNEEMKQHMKVRDVLRGFGNESPLETMKKLAKLQQESPKKTLAADPDNPELNDYVKKYTQQADELTKKFTEQQARGNAGVGSNAGAAGTDPQQIKEDLRKLQQSLSDPALKQKVGKMLEQIDRPRRVRPPGLAPPPPTPPSQKLEHLFDSLAKLLPWFLFFGALYFVFRYLNKMKKPGPEEFEEEAELEIQASDLQQLQKDLKEILSEKKLTNDEKVVKSFNLALELMRSLNFPKPDGMPAENFPRSFPKPISQSMAPDFENITELFSGCFYGKFPVTDRAVQDFDQSMNQLFREADRFQVKDRKASGEI